MEKGQEESGECGREMPLLTNHKAIAELLFCLILPICIFDHVFLSPSHFPPKVLMYGSGDR